MNVALFAGGLVILTQPSPPAPLPASAAPVRAAIVPAAPSLADVLNTPSARDAMARVAYAEAGNQGESGLAAVVYTIINRLQDGRWGGSAEAVVDAPHQFEPVMRVGGDWRRLPPVTLAQEATVHTIVALALQGRLPDLTGGARYFQNEKTVAERAAAGAVPSGLVGFGRATPSAKIGAHTFYPEVGQTSATATAKPGPAGQPKGPTRASDGDIFFGENRAENQAADPFKPSAPAP